MLSIANLIKNRGNIWTVSTDSTVLDALHVLSERNIGVVPVVDPESGQMIGIFSERDYARRVVLFGRTSKDTPITEVMTSKVYTVDSERHIDDCMKIVVEKGFRHLPVMEDEELIGIVSANDLLAEVIRSREKKIGDLQNLLTGAGEIT